MNRYIERAKQLISEPTNSYRLIDSGWSNVIVEINDTWICRFVRETDSPQFKVECKFLEIFASQSPMRIPVTTQIGDDFMIYRRLSGERFSPDRYLSFSPMQKQVVHQQIGEFLTWLHSCRFENEQLSAFPYGGEDFWIELWLLVEKRLSYQCQQKAKRYFDNLFEEIDFDKVKHVITHSDLATNNILYDYQKKQFAGVIDFSDLCLADPAVDFAGFYRHFGRAFVDGILSNYRQSTGDNFIKRVEFQGVRKLFFVVYFALNNGYDDSIPSVIKAIEDWFNHD